MWARVALFGLLGFGVSGCSSILLEQNAANVAPILFVEEVTRAAIAFRLQEDRWPLTRAELEMGAHLGKIAFESFQFIEELAVVEDSAISILYRCNFLNRGISEVRINLK